MSFADTSGRQWPKLCPKCGSEMLEVNVKDPNETWHQTAWLCWKCGHEEKVQ